MMTFIAFLDVKRANSKYYDPYTFDPQNLDYQNDIRMHSTEEIPDKLGTEDCKFINVQMPRSPTIRSFRQIWFGQSLSSQFGVLLNQITSFTILGRKHPSPLFSEVNMPSEDTLQERRDASPVSYAKQHALHLLLLLRLSLETMGRGEQRSMTLI